MIVFKMFCYFCEFVFVVEVENGVWFVDIDDVLFVYIKGRIVIFEYCFIICYGCFIEFGSF